MYEHCFRNLGAEMKAKLKESRTPLVGFSNKVSYPIRTINLSVTMGEPERLRTIPMEFAIVKSHSPYDVILGRTNARGWKKHEDQPWKGGSPSPEIQAHKSEGITNKGREESRGQTDKVGEPDGTIQSSPIPSKKDTQTDEKDKGKDEPLEKSLESKPPEKVVIHDDYPDQTIIIGGNLSIECRSGLIEILRKHADAFAWTPADMTGIPRFIAEHELKIYPHIEPRVQRKWSIAPDRRKVVKDEVVE
ncbi:hypothetical protein Tco_0450850 [Tanacetum coccineum]